MGTGYLFYNVLWIRKKRGKPLLASKSLRHYIEVDDGPDFLAATLQQKQSV